VGVNALHRESSDLDSFEPYEVLLRVAAKTATLKDAALIGREVETLYTNGPAGGGGATKGTREIIAVMSAFIPREAVTPQLAIKEVE